MKSSNNRATVMVVILLVVAFVAFPLRFSWAARNKALSQASDLRAEATAVEQKVALAQNIKNKAYDLGVRARANDEAVPTVTDLPELIDLTGSIALGQVSWSKGGYSGTNNATPETAPPPASTSLEDTSTVVDPNAAVPAVDPAAAATAATSKNFQATAEFVAPNPLAYIDFMERLRVANRAVVIDSFDYVSDDRKLTINARSFVLPGLVVPTVLAGPIGRAQPKVKPTIGSPLDVKKTLEKAAATAVLSGGRDTATFQLYDPKHVYLPSSPITEDNRVIDGKLAVGHVNHGPVTAVFWAKANDGNCYAIQTTFVDIRRGTFKGDCPADVPELTGAEF